MVLAQCINEAEKYELVGNDTEDGYENPHEELFQSLCYSDCNGNGICDKGLSLSVNPLNNLYFMH